MHTHGNYIYFLINLSAVGAKISPNLQFWRFWHLCAR